MYEEKFKKYDDLYLSLVTNGPLSRSVVMMMSWTIQFRNRWRKIRLLKVRHRGLRWKKTLDCSQVHYVWIRTFVGIFWRV